MKQDSRVKFKWAKLKVEVDAVHRKITFAPQGWRQARWLPRRAGGRRRRSAVGRDIPGCIRRRRPPMSYCAKVGDGLDARRRAEGAESAGREGLRGGSRIDSSIPLAESNHKGIDLYVTHVPTPPQNINIEICQETSVSKRISD